MLLNKEQIQAAYQAFNMIFMEVFTGVKPSFERIASFVRSDTRENHYPFLGRIPGMRKWVGERHVKSFEAGNYIIKNEDFEATVEVDRNDVSDNKIGSYSFMFAGLARAAAENPDKLVYGLLAKGFETLCFDGQNFFDTDHPVGSATVSNSGGGAGTAWFLLDTDKPVKPIIFQRREDPKLVAQDDPNSDNVFMRKLYRYGVDSREAVGFAFWQLAYGSKQTLDAASYETARVAMMSLKDEEGSPLGITPKLLVVPASLEGAARDILTKERLANGEENKWKGTAELFVSPWL